MDPVTLLTLFAAGVAGALFSDARGKALPPVVVQVLYKDRDARLAWQTTWLRSEEALRLTGDLFGVDVKDWVGKIPWGDQSNASFRAVTIIRINGNPDEQALVLLQKVGSYWTPSQVFGHRYNKATSAVNDALSRAIRGLNAEASYGLYPGDVVSLKLPGGTAIVRLTTWASVQLQSMLCDHALYSWLRAQDNPSLFAFKIASQGEDPKVSFVLQRQGNGTFTEVQAAGFQNRPVSTQETATILTFVNRLNANRTPALEPTSDADWSARGGEEPTPIEDAPTEDTPTEDQPPSPWLPEAPGIGEDMDLSTPSEPAPEPIFEQTIDDTASPEESGT